MHWRREERWQHERRCEWIVAVPFKQLASAKASAWCGRVYSCSSASWRAYIAWPQAHLAKHSLEGVLVHRAAAVVVVAFKQLACIKEGGWTSAAPIGASARSCGTGACTSTCTTCSCCTGHAARWRATEK